MQEEKQLNKEEWREVRGYEGLYWVSSFGRIKSKRRFLKFSINRYYRVTLSKKSIRKVYLVHRIIAKTFLENPKNLPYVNHKDFNKINNVVENLEWVTAKENNDHYLKSIGFPKIKVKNIKKIIKIENKLIKIKIEKFIYLKYKFRVLDTNNIVINRFRYLTELCDFYHIAKRTYYRKVSNNKNISDSVEFILNPSKR